MIIYDCVSACLQKFYQARELLPNMYPTLRIESSLETFWDWLEKYGDVQIIALIIAAIVGAILTRLIPFVYSLLCKIALRLGRKIGGRLAFRDFEKRYLDWVITELGELKLTGIVSSDVAKKPQLEQVFVSLRMGERRDDDGSDLKLATLKEATEIMKHELKVRMDRQWSPAPVLRILAKLFQASLMGKKTLRRLLRPDSEYIYTRLMRAVEDVESIGFSGVGAKRLMRERLRSLVLTFPLTTFENLELIANFENWYKTRTELDFSRILSAKKRVVILGDPGSGKTTLLQYLALTYARERAGDSKLRRRGILKERLNTETWRVPVFISLGSMAKVFVASEDGNFEQSILDYLPQVLPPDLQRDPIAVDYFVHQLEKGNCLILLDGLDEVPTDIELNVVIKAIKSLAVNYRENQFVVTSRIAGWRRGLGSRFEAFYVNDLTDSQISDFIDSWYSAVELNAVVGRLEDESYAERKARQRRAKRRAADLKRALMENIGIRRLANNPMLLSIIALVHRSLATLPRERSKLYAACSTILLEQWDVSRAVRVDDTNLRLEQKEAIMRNLAYAFHTGQIGGESGGREAKRPEVEAVISKMLPALGRHAGDARHLLSRLVERSGIITERQRGVLSFAHHTFQEYFAAQYLATEGSRHDAFLLDEKRLMSDWWQEVILLYTGLLPDSSQFLRSVVSPSKDGFCRLRLRLAGLCLGEAIEIRETEVRNSIAKELVMIRTRGDITRVSQSIQLQTISYLTRWSRSELWFFHAADTSMKQAKVTEREAEILQEIMIALENPRKLVRLATLRSLVPLSEGFVSNQLVRRVVALSGDEDAEIRELSIDVIQAICGIRVSDELVILLANALRDKASSVREAAARALRSLDERSLGIAYASADCFSMMNEENEAFRLTSAKVFPLFGNHTTSQETDAFLKLLGDSDSEVREAAALSLEELLCHYATDDVVTKLVGMLTGKNRHRHPTPILRTLGELEDRFISKHAIVDLLFSFLGSKDSNVKEAAIYALVRLVKRGIDVEVITKTVELLDSADGNMKASAIDAIEKLEEVTKSTVMTEEIQQKFFSSLHSRDKSIRRAAVSALKLTKVEAIQYDTSFKVLKLVEDRDLDVQVAAIQTLGSLGHKASAPIVIDTLLYLLFGQRRRTRKFRVSLDEALVQAIAKLYPGTSHSPTEVRRWCDTLIRSLQGRGSLLSRIILSLRGVGTRVSAQSAAAELLGVVGVTMETDRIVDELCRTIRNRKSPRRLQQSALTALVSIGNKTGQKRIFDVIIQTLRRGQWTGSEEEDGLIGRLALMCKKLPKDFVVHEIAMAIASDDAQEQILGLELLKRLNTTVWSEDLIDKSVLPALEKSTHTQVQESLWEIIHMYHRFSHTWS